MFVDKQNVKIMSMVRRVFVSAVVFFLGLGFQQQLQAQKTWLNFYACQDTSAFQDIEITDDGGIVGVGTNSYSFYGNPDQIIRVDKFGNTVYQLNIQDTLKTFSEVEITDTGFITIGAHGPNLEGQGIIASFDDQGNQLWQDQQSIFSEFRDVYGTVSSDGYLMAGSNASPVFTPFHSVELFHYDVNGNLTWQDSLQFSNGDRSYISNVTPHPSQGYLLSGANESSGRAHITRISAQGDSLWTTYLYSPNDFYPSFNETAFEWYSIDHIVTDSGRILVTGFKHVDFGIDTSYVYKLDTAGNILWQKIYPRYSATAVRQTNGGNFVLAGYDHPSPFTKLLKIDPNGDSLWAKSFDQQLFQPTIMRKHPQVEITDDNFIILTGSKNFRTQQSVPKRYILKVDSNGQFLRNRIVGNVYIDEDSNCVQSSNEVGVQNQFINAAGGLAWNQYTDTGGHYEMNVAIDTYTVSYQSSSPYTNTSACTDDTQTIQLNTTLQTDTVNFPLTPNIQCPYLTVDLSTPLLRRCFASTYTVQYCNEGTATADSAYVEVNFDPYLHVDSSSIPWQTPQSGNLYRFNIGNVPIGDCGSFKVHVTVDCDSTMIGQTHCSSAHIYPDSLCLPDTSGWNGAQVEVDANCSNGDTVQFRVQNTGTGDMQDSLRYYIVEDNVMLRTPEFQLDSGQTLFDYEPANGNTYRIEAEQVANVPYESQPAAWTEGCGGFSTTGAVTDYFQNDASPFVSTDCQQNIAPFDPNDKQATPEGRGIDGTITQNRALEYKIRFQNVGTDTAFRVVIRDTLSQNLDISTIQLGASSHNYQFRIHQNRILEWEFPNIELPDSNVNEPASHGFVKFRVEQQDSLPIGTEIRNSAAIYFDFNDPVITNQTLNTIGRDYRKVVYVEEKSRDVEQIDVYPNPSREHVTFDIKGQQYNQLKLRIFNIKGQEVRSYGFRHTNRLTLDNLQLQQGTYLFEITAKGQQVGAGKLLVR